MIGNRTILGEALYIAVQENKKAEVKKILKADVDINWKCPITGNTALHCAAEGNKYELALLLLDKDADAAIKNNNNVTPINSAVNAAFWDFVIKFAKRRRASVNDDYGLALYLAAFTDNTAAVIALLEAGAPTNWRVTTSKDTSLHFAAKYNNTEMIRALRAYSADVNALDSDNKTPIDVATAYARLSGNFRTVLAFTENPVENSAKNEKIIIEDLEDLISTVSTRTVKSYCSRTDWREIAEKKGFKTHASRNGFYKDSILSQILDLHDPVLKQKALWQALDPNTFLGKFFRIMRGVIYPSINAGRLKQIRIALQRMLAANDLAIDDEVKKNIYHDLQIIRYFPKLIDKKFPIFNINQIVIEITPASTASDDWFKIVYGKLIGKNKTNAYLQICSIPDLNLRQKALWQALDPNTYLGKIFHTQRGLFKPSYDSGTLKLICDALSSLIQKNNLVIDASVRTSLLRQPYIANYFSMLKSQPQLHAAEPKDEGNKQEEQKEHKDDAHAPPPPYDYDVPNGQRLAQTSPSAPSSSSTAVITGSFIPQPYVTPGKDQPVPEESHTEPTIPVKVNDAESRTFNVAHPAQRRP